MAEEDAVVAEPVEVEAVAEPEEVETDAEEVEAEAETEESEVEAKSEDEPSESSTENKPDKVQERIRELNRLWRDEQRGKQALEVKIQELEANQPKEEPVIPGKTLADFEYDEGAYAEYLTASARQAAEAAVEEKSQRDVAEQRMAKFTEKESDFAVDIEDYNTVTRADSLPITPYMLEAMQTAEKGPEVLYYLGKNPGIARELSKMPPLDMARELGRIEAIELAKPEKSIKTPTPPPPKLKPTASPERVSPASEASDKLSDKEWLRRRNKQLEARK